MVSEIQAAEQKAEAVVRDFFRLCEGGWRSERRYYTVENDKIQEVVSHLKIRFLEKKALNS